MSNSYASSFTIRENVVEVVAENKEEDKEMTPSSDIEQYTSMHESPKGWNKALLVSLLCGAQFFDVFTGSSAIAALPTVR